MFQFVEDVKDYLESKFANDSSISSTKRPKVFSGYQVGHEPTQKQPEIQVQPLDDSEIVSYTSFCRDNASSVPLQITVYTGQLRISGKDYNAQEASMILADKVNAFMSEYIHKVVNKNLIYGRRVGGTPALPMNDTGSMYMTPVRYELQIQEPYVEG